MPNTSYIIIYTHIQLYKSGVFSHLSRVSNEIIQVLAVHVREFHFDIILPNVHIVTLLHNKEIRTPCFFSC